MGANDFQNVGYGTTYREAFNTLVDQAQWEHGHGGYSGTIAEKHDVVLITPPAGVDPVLYIDWLLDGEQVPAEYAARVADDAPKVNDKWGPAGVIALGPDPKTGVPRWLFFGWASS